LSLGCANSLSAVSPPQVPIEVIKYDKKEYKLDELKEFLNPNARWAKKESKRKDAKKEDTNED
jgi:hypothetical protein